MSLPEVPSETFLVELKSPELSSLRIVAIRPIRLSPLGGYESWLRQLVNPGGEDSAFKGLSGATPRALTASHGPEREAMSVIE